MAAKKTPHEEAAPEQVAEPAAEVATVVHSPAGWSLVQHGNWEVSIGPDGMIMLPRHLAPDEVADFVAAVNKAAEVGAEQQAANQQAAALKPNLSEGTTLVVQKSGQTPPPGAVQLLPSTASGSTAKPSPPAGEVRKTSD